MLFASQLTEESWRLGGRLSPAARDLVGGSMKSTEFERLLSDLKGDDALRGEFHRLGGDLEPTLRLAATKGYPLTREEAAELAQSFHELSDEELDQAAGGAWNDPPTPPPPGTSG
jgi:predicted ribosomally synthesized peptide with nif11-like leader